MAAMDRGDTLANDETPEWDGQSSGDTQEFGDLLLEKEPQRPWPKDRIWSFKSSPKFFGSPMLDAVINNSPLDREMVHWLKHRPAIFQAMWDQ
ncbi:hypothetical protein VNO78_05994 [Psophocarpus tetragonolobus]|uniref:ATXR3 C-terminal domain-containing protein n=1 Tax=Psophocarpus tetragonolobus TaxID=3891 RepID=A0AAN9XR97_PSOTE